MGRSGVTYQEIKQMADKILLNGEHPSIYRVREMLGTGSNTTISEHLKQWRNERQRKSINTIPDTVPAELAATFENLWFKAVELAEASLSTIQDKLTVKASDLESSRYRYEHKEEMLEGELSRLREELKCFQQNERRMKENDLELKYQMTELQNQNSKLAADLIQSNDKNVQNVKQMKAQFETEVRYINQHAEKIEVHFNQSEANLLKQLDDSRQLVKQLKKDENTLIQALREEKSILNTNMGTLQAEAFERQREVHRLQLKMRTLNDAQQKNRTKRAVRRNLNRL